MKKYFTFLFILLMFSVPIFSQKTHKLKGTIKAQNDEIIAGANLYFEKDGKTNIVSANINGEFETQLSVGDYKITVNKELSESFIAFVKIQDDGLNPQNLDLTIQTHSARYYPQIIKSIPAKYPPAAIATGTKGEVTVSVKIDKEGKVISAKAESGHPLLRKASETAALNTVFEASENMETRDAKLTYVFIFLWKTKDKKDLNRFTSPYRIEIVNEMVPLEY